MKREIRLYDAIFPLFLILFFPPLIFVALAGNLIIDSLVVVICYFAFKISGSHQMNLFCFYRKSIVKVWLLGFLADILSTMILFVIEIIALFFGIKNFGEQIMNPLASPLAVIITILTILTTGLLIFLFNYRVTFKNLIQEDKLRFKIALTIALTTMPWTILLPSQLMR